MDDGNSSVIDLAKRLARSGLSVIPIRPDGSKSPMVDSWIDLKNRILSESEIDKYFVGNCGIAIIGGSISGNLEILDFDSPKVDGSIIVDNVFDEWLDSLDPDTLGIVNSMPKVVTPGGGVHLYYRCVTIEGNLKLAKKYVEKENRNFTIIETRGEGGYCLAPGSPAECHPSGKEYVLEYGSFESIPTITEDQRNSIIEISRTFGDDLTRPVSHIEYPHNPLDGRLKPGDDFDSRGTWEEILQPLGWSYAGRRRDGALLWTRPGKSRGVSATIREWTHDGVTKEYFYNFSANGDPFPEEKPLTKFQAYTIAYHNGDFKSAARELGKSGYGDKNKRSSRVDIDEIVSDKRGDDVPWFDSDVGISKSKVITEDVNANYDDLYYPEIDYDTNRIPETKLSNEPVEVLDLQIYEIENNIKIEDKKKIDIYRERLREINLSRGPAYLAWRDFGDPPERKLTKEGRIKTMVDKPRDTMWHILNDKFCYNRELRTLHYQNREFMLWDGFRYRRLEEDDIRPTVSSYLTHFSEFKELDEDGNPIYEPYKVRKSRVMELMVMAKDMTHIDSDFLDPSWLVDDHESLPDPREVVSCSNGLLDMPNRRLIDPTPGFYSFTNTNIYYDSNAEEPKAWLSFLDTTLDEESALLLQEWFGYCLVQDTRLQKILMVVGDPGSGKGTAMRVLQRLVGHGSYCSMNFDRLGGNFSLSVALGKSLMIFPDARQNYSSDNKGGIVSTLLSISGEDDLMIDRKNLPPITQKLNTRIVIVSNEVLMLQDTSGALDRRQLWIRFPGFKSDADPDLQRSLDSELSGILNWAIEGWHRIKKTGEFTEPESSKYFRDSFREQSSPIKIFIEDMCDLDESAMQPVGEIFNLWNVWRKVKGYKSVQSAAAFGKQLISSSMSIRKIRPRAEDGKSRVYVYSGIRVNKDKMKSFIINNSGEDVWNRVSDEYAKNNDADIINLFEWAERSGKGTS